MRLFGPDFDDREGLTTLCGSKSFMIMANHASTPSDLADLATGSSRVASVAFGACAAERVSG
jgi:hypothetical protein